MRHSHISEAAEAARILHVACRRAFLMNLRPCKAALVDAEHLRNDRVTVHVWGHRDSVKDFALDDAAYP